MLRFTVKPSLPFTWFCFLMFSLWITLLGSWKKQLYFRKKYMVLFASFLWRWVGVCTSEVMKSEAQALIRHQFDCFSFKDKEDSNWAWSQSLWSVWHGISKFSLHISVTAKCYITSEMSLSLHLQTNQMKWLDLNHEEHTCHWSATVNRSQTPPLMSFGNRLQSIFHDLMIFFFLWS